MAPNATEGLAALRKYEPEIVLLDMRLPDVHGIEVLKEIVQHSPSLPVVVISAYADFQTAIDAMKNGAREFLLKPVQLDLLAHTLRKVRETLALRRRVSDLSSQLRERYLSSSLLGDSQPMREVYAKISKVVDSNVNVLVRGESGTGKELVARAVHFNGPRSAGPFVAINLAAVPATLIESELFGHEKGAFTGAITRRRGKFEEAKGGTLFLDEIGDLAPASQAKLLRVLQERTIYRLGGGEAISIDVRVIAATHRNLETMIASGEFREDLYFRLNVFPIVLPPLRDRSGDIDILAATFIKRGAEREKKKIVAISPDAMERLRRAPWPGNIRELENAIDLAVVNCEGDTIRIEDLPPTLPVVGRSAVTETRPAVASAQVAAAESALPIESLAQTERRAIEKVILQ
ncbi:MAG: sigma-54-dependent transcriptional regulator, partial [Vicinamibacteria bacterium]